MTKWFNLKTVAALSASAFLVACGGGGGGSGGSPAPAPGPVKSTETFQLKTAYNNYLLESGSQAFTATGALVQSGTSYPITGSGRTTWGTLVSSTWESAFAYSKTTTVTGSVTVNGNTVSLASSSGTYVDANYNPLGNTGSEYVDVTSYNAIPVTAKVDYSASWYEANRYTTSSKTSKLGTRSTSITLEPDTANTAILLFIATDKDNAGSTKSVSTVKFRMTPAGVLTRLSETEVSYSGTQITTININYQ